jgi:cell division transport system permease protein
LFEFSFFSPVVSITIICVSILLCTIGSYSTMQKFLRI